MGNVADVVGRDCIVKREALVAASKRPQYMAWLLGDAQEYYCRIAVPGVRDAAMKDKAKVPVLVKFPDKQKHLYWVEQEGVKVFVGHKERRRIIPIAEFRGSPKPTTEATKREGA